MADTLSANILETSQELIVATIALMPQMAPMLGLVTRKSIPKGNNAVEIPRVNSTSSVQTPTEGDELVNSSQFDLTSTTITPTHRAIMVRVHDRATYFSKEDVLALVSEELGQTQAQDIDTDILAEFANFATANDVGTSNTTTGNIATLRTARRKLRSVTRANGGPPRGMLRCVLSPFNEEELFEDLGLRGAVTNTTPWIPNGWSQEMMASYAIPQNQLVGVSMFIDGYMTEDSSGDYIGAMFSEDALWFAVSKDWDIRTFEVPNWIGPIIRSVADYNSAVGGYTYHGAQITFDGA